MARQYEESIAQFQKALDLNPNLPVVHAMLALAYVMKRMYPQALPNTTKLPIRTKSQQQATSSLLACFVGFMPSRAGGLMR
jgi:tetratricopeptide (TPR) repeat protein